MTKPTSTAAPAPAADTAAPEIPAHKHTSITRHGGSYIVLPGETDPATETEPQTALEGASHVKKS